MKSTWRVLIASLLVGLSVWLLDAAADYWFFYRGETFLNLLVIAPPPHEIYIRILILFFFISFGLVTTHRLQREYTVSQNLKRALRDKEILLREVHHRVKNNLSVILGLIKLEIDAASSEASVLEELYGRVNSIALIHNYLYRGEHLDVVELDRYISELTDEIMGLYISDERTIAVEKKLDAVTVSLDTAVPCGLILCELIQNACKHAFVGRGGGTLSISLRRLDRDFEIEVSDDGRGVDADALGDEGTASIGFALIEALAEQIDARLETYAGKGVSVVLTVPIGGTR
ncbi:MAG: sensor histidine kinase [Spirochaetales bacterium]|nr:sensor histidine kinase [Spirochaetales bacterium]